MTQPPDSPGTSPQPSGQPGQAPAAGSGWWPGQGAPTQGSQTAGAAGQGYPTQGFPTQGAPAYPPAPPQGPPPPPLLPPGGTGDGGADGGGGKGPRLPGAVIALIALAVVVVLGVVGFIAFDTLTRDKSDSTDTGASHSQAAGGLGDGHSTAASDPNGGRPDHVESFDAVSGNIHCEIGKAYARCLIVEVNPGFDEPAPPANCGAANYGRVAVATPDKVGYDCKEQSPPSGGKKLSYGKSISKPGMKCTSTKTGMECYATQSGKGFTIARAGITWKK